MFQPLRPWASGAARGLLAATVLAALPAVPGSVLAADPVRQIEVDHQNVESRVRLVDSDLKTAIGRKKRYPVQRRFIEATMAYSRGNWDTATVLLIDLTHNEEFQRSPDYYESLFMLGDALYRMRNYKAAQKYLQLLLHRRGGKHFQGALKELVDIAIRLHRFELVSQYASHLSSIPPGKRLTELLYQFGRSFFAAGKFARARKYLGQVPVGTKRWAHGRFYLGAILAHEGKWKDAEREFRDVVSAGRSRDEQRRPPQVVLDYSNLALGRIYLQQKKYDDAVFHYQSVDRNSPVYEEALFEMAATQVADSKPKKALEALDILLLTVSDDRVRVEAAVLRGRINLMTRQYDNADASYKEVVDQYSAISGEMERFAHSTERLEQFFSWLLNRSSDDYSVVRPVSKRVAKYIEKDEDMGRVVHLFDEMANEKRDVKISAKIAATIEAALKSGTSLDMFPVLKDNWLKLVESENTVVKIGERIVELLRKYALPSLSPEERRQADVIRKERLAYAKAFAKVPATARALTRRSNSVAAAWNNLAASVSLLKAALGGVRNQILAIEKMLNERVYGTEGVTLSKEREAEIRAALQKEKDNLRRTYREIESLQVGIETAAAGSGGPGDQANRNEDRVRGALLARQRAEQQIYVRSLRRTHSHTGDAGRLVAVRQGLDRTLVDIGRLYRHISDTAGAKTADIRAVLRKEKRNIADYKVRVRGYEAESRYLARTVGFSLIRKAQQRLSDVVLEADLGLVDVAWQRKQDKARQIRALQNERATKQKTLQGVLNSLADEEEAM